MPEMRKAIIGDLKSKSVPEAVIRETAQKLIASEYLERVCKVTIMLTQYKLRNYSNILQE